MTRPAISFCILFATAGILFAAEGRLGPDTAFERSLREIDPQDLDFKGLRERVRLRMPSATDGEIDLLIERNLRFIYLNKLNRQRFLLAPDPQSVIDRMVSVLELSRRIDALVLEARRLIGEESPGASADRLVADLGAAARDLKRAFGGYFVEGHSSSYSLKLPVSRDASTQFAFFVIQSGRISEELSRRLDAYFFNDSPQAVSLDDYRSSSVGTLAESLHRLSDLVGRRLSAGR